MQHTPLWKSKFRILGIKKTRTKIGTFENFAHKFKAEFKASLGHPTGSFTKTNLRKMTRFGD